MDFSSPAFWISVGQIILIDILLGGDNAVVIALACRRLPPEMRNKGIFWGVVGAVGARIVLIFFALQLLALPYLKFVGGALLLWIGVKLMLPEDEDAHGKLDGGTTLWSAVRTVVVADVVMSLDNVIAVAAAADGHLGLVVFGILVSVPIIVWGSKFVLMLIDRFPSVVIFGAGLLGWIAGAMMLGDEAWKGWVATLPSWSGKVAAVLGAAFVVGLGLAIAQAKKARRAAAASALPAVAPSHCCVVAVDGSSPVEAIAAYVKAQQQRDPSLAIHLLNVQLPVDTGHARMFVGEEQLREYYDEEAQKDLAPAIAAFQAQGVTYEVGKAVGHVAETIVKSAAERGAETIVIGRRSATHRGAGSLLPSIASEVASRATVPVTLVG